MTMDSLFSDLELAALTVPAEESAQEAQVRPIDLVSREHLAFALVPELQRALDQMVKGLARNLTLLFRANCQIHANPVEIIPGGRLGDLVTNRRFMYAIELMDGTPTGTIVIDDVLADLYVVQQFGGPMGVNPAQRDATTATELRTVRRFAEQIIALFRQASAPICPTDFKLNVKSYDPAGGSSMLLAAAQLMINDATTNFTFAIDTAVAGFRKPTTTLDSPSLAAHLIKPHLQRVHLTAHTILGRRDLTLRDILTLKVGDIVHLDSVTDSALPVLVEGRAKFLGKPVVQRGNLALEITEQLKE